MDGNRVESHSGRRAFLQSLGLIALASELLPNEAAAAADVKGAQLTTPSGKPIKMAAPSEMPTSVKCSIVSRHKRRALDSI